MGTRVRFVLLPARNRCQAVFHWVCLGQTLSPLSFVGPLCAGIIEAINNRRESSAFSALFPLPPFFLAFFLPFFAGIFGMGCTITKVPKVTNSRRPSTLPPSIGQSQLVSKSNLCVNVNSFGAVTVRVTITATPPFPCRPCPRPLFTSRTGKMPENSNYRELAAKIA